MSLISPARVVDLPYPVEEYEARWERLYDELARRGQRTAVIWQRSAGSYDRAGDLHWLCNYASLASGQEPDWLGSAGKGFAALVFHDRQQPVLHIAEPEGFADLEQIATDHVVHHDNLPAGLATYLVDNRIEGAVLHNGDDFVPWNMVRILEQKAPEVEWIATNDLFWKIHRIKSPLELDAMRRTGDVASRALTALMEGLIAGERECDAAARAASEIVRAGGGITRIGAAHGKKSETIFWSRGLYGYGTEAPVPGDLVRGWVYGPLLDGIWLDPGRVAVCGNKPTAAQRRLIESAVGVVESLVGAIKPGVDSRDVGRLGDRLMEEAGNEADVDLWDLYGHGIGKDFYMTPVIPRLGVLDDFADVYEPGMAFTVELFLLHKGVGFATLETTGLVTETGTEILDTTPMIWW